MASSRIPDLPQVIDDPRVKEFLELYYKISNDLDAHDEYTNLFIPDGEFSLNEKKAKGKEGEHLQAPLFSNKCGDVVYQSVQQHDQKNSWSGLTESNYRFAT